MFLGSSCCNIAENSTFARPLDFACRLNPSFHAFAEACATETLGAYPSPWSCLGAYEYSELYFNIKTGCMMPVMIELPEMQEIKCNAA